VEHQRKPRVMTKDIVEQDTWRNIKESLTLIAA
jgi:hypothetical protein